ncbi:MAG: response regulator [Bacteroidales bacterium]|nr:response regulator [Bacteroidales bacterium]
MNKKILIVDDSGTNNILLKNLLLKEGIISIVAYSTAEALDILSKTNFNIIILNLTISEFGFVFLDKLKQSKRTKDIPIVFITAKNKPELKQKVLNIDISDYIEKPINFNYIINLVKEFLFN